MQAITTRGSQKLGHERKAAAIILAQLRQGRADRGSGQACPVRVCRTLSVILLPKPGLFTELALALASFSRTPAKLD